MNKVIITGNVVRDLELRKTGSGISNVSFSVAVQRKFANAQGVKETDFLTVVAWRQLADVCAKYLSKGSKVGVIGSLQSRSYESQDGSKRFVTEIIAEDIEFLGSKNQKSNDNSDADVPAAPAQNGPAQMTEVDEDDLPF